MPRGKCPILGMMLLPCGLWRLRGTSCTATANGSKLGGDSMYCRKCPWCGAYLDPGEICDCQEDGK